MNATRDYSVLWVCTDCYFTHHDGSPSDDPDYEPDRTPLNLISNEDEVRAGLLWTEHDDECPNRQAGKWVDECECEHREFTWSACQGCGSTLGGSRDALTLWHQS